ncbi:hypothetical protein I5F82_23420, partial [Pseudomonas aeruginosa]|nr:hypothetical protein [Pseudomonas aeruginosa]
LELVGIVGAVTLVLARFAPPVQTPIQRLHPDSPKRPIGGMFLARGGGAGGPGGPGAGRPGAAWRGGADGPPARS